MQKAQPDAGLFCACLDYHNRALTTASVRFKNTYKR